MAVTCRSASRCTTQDVEEARARAPFAKLGSTENVHRVGIVLGRFATVAKRPSPAIRACRKLTFRGHQASSEGKATESPHPHATTSFDLANRLVKQGRAPTAGELTALS